MRCSARSAIASRSWKPDGYRSIPVPRAGGVLEVRGLRVRYPGGLLALDDVSLMAHPGDAVAVVGPIGSGKSTLLRVVIGLAPPQAGAVRFNGEALTGLPPHQRAARGIA